MNEREKLAEALGDIAWDECPLGVHGRYQRTPARSCPWCVAEDAEQALAAAREDAEYRRAVADVLKAKHEGGSGAFWAEWHRDHCAAAQAADEARAEVADVTDLRDRLAKVQAVLADSCHHCGRLPDEDGDHTCTCPVTDSECLEHTAEPVVSLSAVLAALGDADTLAERCPVSDAALGRCVLDAHDGDIHAWEGGRGSAGPPQRWQSSERADRIEPLMNEREKLAEALGDIRVADARQADWWTNDEEHALLIRVLRGECVPWAEGLIAAGWVSPETLAEVKARAKAEALREFADECDGPDSSLHVMGAAQAARDRADRIEGATDE